MKAPLKDHAAAGFTLVEVLIAAALLSISLGAMMVATHDVDSQRQMLVSGWTARLGVESIADAVASMTTPEFALFLAGCPGADPLQAPRFHTTSVGNCAYSGTILGIQDATFYPGLCLSVGLPAGTPLSSQLSGCASASTSQDAALLSWLTNWQGAYKFQDITFELQLAEKTDPVNHLPVSMTTGCLDGAGNTSVGNFPNCSKTITVLVHYVPAPKVPARALTWTKTIVE